MHTSTEKEHNNQGNTIGASKAFLRTKQSIPFTLSDLYLCRISTITTTTTTTITCTTLNPRASVHATLSLVSAISSSLEALSLSLHWVRRVESRRLYRKDSG